MLALTSFTAIPTPDILMSPHTIVDQQRSCERWLSPKNDEECMAGCSASRPGPPQVGSDRRGGGGLGGAAASRLAGRVTGRDIPGGQAVVGLPSGLAAENPSVQQDSL